MVDYCFIGLLLLFQCVLESLNTFAHLYDLIVLAFDQELALPKFVNKGLVSILFSMPKELSKLSLEKSLLHSSITRFICID